MKMKNKNSKLNFTFRLCIFWFSLLLLCNLVSFAGDEVSSDQLDPANFLINAPEKTPQDSNKANVPQKQAKSQPQANQKEPLQAPPEPNKAAANTADTNRNIDTGESKAQLLHKLWQAQISAPKGENNSKNIEELQRIIRQLHAGLEPKKQPAAPAKTAAVTPKNEPNQANETSSVKETPTKIVKKPEAEKIEAKLPFEAISNETLQKFNNLSQHPDQMNNPLELGEVLFLSGHLKEAAIAYQEALNRIGANDANSTADRAWLLFQIGNCLRNDDPPTAAKMYKQLIQEYPNSRWTELAKTEDKLIEWYQKDTPETLVSKRRL
jgi:tetratricopeptide (TPR) repeat protein